MPEALSSTVHPVQGLVLTGTRGAGKTTVVRELCGSGDQHFEQPSGTTTRSPRSGDASEYVYVSESEFRRSVEAGEFLVHSEYAGAFYGYSYSTLAEVRGRGHIPVLTLTPRAASGVAESGGWVVLALDAADAVLDARLVERGAEFNCDGERARREVDRRSMRGFTVLDNSDDLDATLRRIEGSYSGGVRHARGSDVLVWTS
jgi:guanylate kinase